MKRILAIGLLTAAGTVLAADADEDALRLADEAPAAVERARDWQWFVEGAFGQSALRSGGTVDNQRLSIDVQLDKALAPGWRAVFADRLDLNWHDQPTRQNGINTLKEAYVSWQARDDQLFDFGRINARYGVATGYNPTDYFRAGATRFVVSADPASLKKNRMGSVMLRTQSLWESGSLTALYSPKLATRPNEASLNPDIGATNNQHRWLIAASHKLSDNIEPQWLLYDEEHKAPQLGFNLAMLVNDATVSYLEWSGGRSRSLLSQALNGADDSAFRSRLSTGLTYTTSNKLSLTLEYQYNGAGLSKAEWDALPRTSPLAYLRYRQALQDWQDMPTRQAVFFYGAWQDVMISHFDLNAMLRFNVADHSRLSWLEARYRWDRAEAALQWQMNSGERASEFGAVPQQRAVQAVLRYFF
ncbi:hypothetical protein [Noviherbaspirillum sp.]|jgi:opacity protein-like surface antigen|uniref:hypothetical protein n=1 Tax=Noviherbaspirillum sp. TaxID=1926288 RepID=UPI0025F21B07|nr:hypothetical protein [Noviherbaspirillum sp.]